MATVRALRVNLSANSAAFAAGMSRAGKSLGKFNFQVESTAARVESRLRGMFVAAAAAFGFHQISEGIDNIGKLSDNLGISTEALVALKEQAAEANVNFDTLTGGIARMFKTISAAGSGGEKADVLKRLGLDPKKLLAASPEEEFTQIAQAISTIQNPAERTAAAMEIFGKSGQQLMGVLRGGKADIAKFRADAEALGLTFSRDAAAKVEAFNDAVTRAGATMRAVFGKVLIVIAPVLKSVADYLASIAGWFNSLSTGSKRLVTTVVILVPTMIALAKAFKLAAASAAFLQAITGVGVAKALVGLAIGAASAIAISKGLQSAELEATGAAKGMTQFADATNTMTESVSAATAPLYQLQETAQGLKQTTKIIGDMWNSTKADEAAKGIDDLIVKYRGLNAVAGLTAEQADLIRLKIMGASPAVLKQVDAWQKQTEAIEKAADPQKEADAINKRIADSQASQASQYNDAISGQRLAATDAGFLTRGGTDRSGEMKQQVTLQQQMVRELEELNKKIAANKATIVSLN